MQMSVTVRRLAVFAACAFAAAGCRGGNGDGAGAVKVDTTNTQWEDGLSAEQVQDSARALSPEEAARMGIAVDTSIHLEQLDSRDTIFGGPPPTGGAADSAGGGSQPVQP